jgi:signal peptidase I
MTILTDTPIETSAAIAAPQDARSSTLRETAGFVLSLVIALLVALLFRSLFFEPFYIPSGSMKPTLLVGDYVFVSKYTYGYSRYSFPLGPNLFEGRMFGRKPERGEIAVFKHPKRTDINYIKRIVGMPGDRMQVKDGRLYINGVLVPKEQLTPFKDDGNEDGEPSEVMVPAYKETLPGGMSFVTLDKDKHGPLDNTGEYVVPAGHYFMMGDNRDNSVDSRVTSDVGFVPEENLIGPARLVMFSSDSPFVRLHDWIARFRPERLFMKLDLPPHAS